MKLSNFLNLSFHEASEHIRKSINERIVFTWSTSESDMIQVVKRINLEDVEWVERNPRSALSHKIEKNQGFIQFEDPYIISRMEARITLYYDEFFTVTYHVGNTRDGVTLREISMSGNGIFWSEELPELSQIFFRGSKVDPKAKFTIPRVYYRNGRKGSLGDFIKKQYSLIKMRYQIACQDFSDYVKSGKLKGALDSVKENDLNPWSYYYGVDFSRIDLCAIQAISDPSGLSLLDVATYVKIMGGYFYEFSDTSLIRRTFYNKTNSLSGGQIKALRGLRDRITANYELTKKLEKLQSQIQTAADYYIQDFVQDNPRYTIENVEGHLMRVSFDSHINKDTDI